MSCNPKLRVLLCGLTLAVGLGVSWSATAQLGSVNNPPAQNLFRFDDKPVLRNDGLGTMAERRRALVVRKARRPVHRRTSGKL